VTSCDKATDSYVVTSGFLYLASNGSTVVEHLPHLPEVKGLSRAAAAGTGRGNGKNVLCTQYV